jgi:hypothetical protein
VNKVITASNYPGRVWTCDTHNRKVEEMINAGEVKEAMALVSILSPKKSRGICGECRRLYHETPPMNR